jgi:Ca2+-binding RTX toxin-like protein
MKWRVAALAAVIAATMLLVASEAAIAASVINCPNEPNTDMCSGTSHADTMNGSDINDLMFGEAGKDSIKGNRGVDTIDGGSGADHVYGGPGDDGDITAGYLLSGGQDGSEDHVYGGTGKDYLLGGFGGSITSMAAEEETSSGPRKGTVLFRHRSPGKSSTAALARTPSTTTRVWTPQKLRDQTSLLTATCETEGTNLTTKGY